MISAYVERLADTATRHCCFLHAPWAATDVKRPSSASATSAFENFILSEPICRWNRRLPGVVGVPCSRDVKRLHDGLYGAGASASVYYVIQE